MQPLVAVLAVMIANLFIGWPVRLTGLSTDCTWTTLRMFSPPECEWFAKRRGESGDGGNATPIINPGWSDAPEEPITPLQEAPLADGETIITTVTTTVVTERTAMSPDQSMGKNVTTVTRDSTTTTTVTTRSLDRNGTETFTSLSHYTIASIEVSVPVASLTVAPSIGADWDSTGK